LKQNPKEWTPSHYSDTLARWHSPQAHNMMHPAWPNGISPGHRGEMNMNNSKRRLAGASFATLLLLGAAMAIAQDVGKVSPETHKLLLENEHVRVFDVRIKPGEKVGMHSHPSGILYYLSNASLKITYPDGKTEVREVKPGTAVWSEAVTHAVENVGPTELHEVHTELKGQSR
jgi:quercetin dioxygenase-like cupin family protein